MSGAQETIMRLRAHHEARLRSELPRLRFLADKVAMVHGPTHPAMGELARIVDTLAQDVAAHATKEDEVVFAAVLAGHHDGLAAPITTLCHEHERHARLIAEARRLCDGFRPWSGACGSVQRLFQGLAALESDLAEHARLAQDELFPITLVGAEESSP
jgi:regulator of cell morphogenesis and NO signaling